MQSMIPLVDLGIQHSSLKPEIDRIINDVIIGSDFIGGKYTKKFETNFAHALGVNNCISCANGTDSLLIAMKALGVNFNDEVIVPSMSWISTASMVSYAGGKVVFCDVKLSDLTIDVDKIESLITDKTRGIIPVHLYGNSADMDPILDIAEKYNLWVVEDCAQSHLAKYKGKILGTMGEFGSFSFYPGKNLGAMGDAGALVTANETLSDSARRYANHGGLRKGEHTLEGMNSRMDSLQAAILDLKLMHLKNWTTARRTAAQKYVKCLEGIPQIQVIEPNVNSESVFHLFVVRAERRDSLIKFLKEQQIDAGIHYATALPELPAFKHLNTQSDNYRVAQLQSKSIVSLPMFPEITEGQIEYISSKVREFYA